MNLSYTLYDKDTKRVRSRGFAHNPQQFVGPTTDIFIGAEFPDGWLDDGIHTPIPPRPDWFYVLDHATRTWIDPRTLQAHKDAKWEDVKQSRTAAEYGGFTWDGSVFDSDQVSQARINGAVTLATQDGGFNVNWTLADNTVRILSAVDVIAVGVALGQHVNACHEKARVLRAQIEAAATVEDIEATVWQN